jgi:hypothetical protein
MAEDSSRIADRREGRQIVEDERIAHAEAR